MGASFTQTLQAITATTTYAIGRLGKTAISLYNVSLLPLEIFSALVVIVLIVATVVIIIKTGWFSLHVNHVRNVVLKTDMSKKEAQKAWAAVQKHFFAGDANDLKMAVMAADNILNDALRYAGVRGGNLGDRLKNIKRDQIPNLDDIWAAHKLRNEIAHEINFSLKRDSAERALETYHAALKNLGVFDE
jgi:hypothetical protein